MFLLRASSPFRYILHILLATTWGSLSVLGSTSYTEDFSTPVKLGNTEARAELGNGGSYTYGTWVYSNGNGGIDQNSTDGNFVSSIGQARPQAKRGSNARAISVIFDGKPFISGVEYTIDFEIIGDPAGDNAGRYWLALVSGHDSQNGVKIDGTHNGWGSGAKKPKPFSASGHGNTVIQYLKDSSNNGVLLDGENTEGTKNVSFSFIHDGISDLAFAVGTYNNVFGIDNFEIKDPNGGNVLPNVRILSGPKKLEELNEGTGLKLQIEASDADGSIESVSVLFNGELFDENIQDSRYTIKNAFRSLNPGPYELSVVATDDRGATASESIDFYIISKNHELTGQHPYRAGMNKVEEYLRFVPDAYNEKPNKSWPLILWLHGTGNRGNDAWSLRGAGGPPSRIKSKDPILQNFIVLSPQCKTGQWWTSNAAQNNIDQLVDQHIERFRIDPDRIIITGQSMGGFGTYTSLLRHPYKYAAAVPICGDGENQRASEIAHLPIWIFHGDQDQKVEYQFSVDWNDALLDAGAENTKFHTIVNGPHNVWTETYKRTDLYEWMLQMSFLSKHYPSTRDLSEMLERDSDGDGKSGQDEFLHGTSPIDSRSVFRYLPLRVKNGQITISWQSSLGQKYTVYRCSDLSIGDWQPIQPYEIPAHTSGINTIVDTISTQSSFYRIETKRE